jgi:hypothetical protein
LVSRPLPAAPLVVRCRCLIVAPMPFPAAPVLKRCAQAVARGTARCVLQERDRSVQAVACGAATLSQQEKNDSADVQRSRVYITGYLKCIGKITLAAIYIRKVRVLGCCFAAALAHLSTVVMPSAPAAQDLGVILRRTCRGQTFSRRKPTRRICSEESKYYRF